MTESHSIAVLFLEQRRRQRNGAVTHNQHRHKAVAVQLSMMDSHIKVAQSCWGGFLDAGNPPTGRCVSLHAWDTKPSISLRA
jgi:hypothetical protein